MQVIDQLSGGGAEKVAKDLLTGIDRQRFELCACVTRQSHLTRSETAALGVELLCLGRRQRFDAAGFARLVKFMRRWKPDVVHCHKVGSNSLGRLAALFARVPVIIGHEHTMPGRSIVQRTLDRWLARRTSLVLACDRVLAQELIAREGLPANKLEVVANGVDLSRFQPDAGRRSAVRRALGVGERPVVGVFARLEAQKDVPSMLAAAKLVLNRLPSTVFLFAGDGPLRAELEDRSRSLGLGDAVRFLGFRRDVPELMQAVDLVALSSGWEGLPVSILEAMASSKPVVSTRVGSVADAVLHGETGLLVAPSSPSELADALVRLLTNTEIAQAMGQAGRLRVERLFSLGAMVERIQSMYLRLVSSAVTKARVLLIGPYPPPEHGTSIPFRLLAEHLRQDNACEVRILNSESGEKKGKSLLSVAVISAFARLMTGFLREVGRSTHILVYGSQRFAATAGALFAFLGRRLFGKNASIYIQGGAFDRYYSSLDRISRALVNLGFGSARAVGVQTELVRAAVSRHIPNAVTIPNWTSLSGGAWPVAGGRSPAAGCRFIFAGDVNRDKGVVELVAAFDCAYSWLKDSGIGVELCIYGPLRDDALAEVAPLLKAHAERISVHGAVAHERLVAGLGRCDVLVLPTRWHSEGYPGVIIEAMSLGLPAIATRFRAIPELVEDGVNGLLCVPGDVESLAGCMVRVATDPVGRAEMGLAALRTARRFDVRRVAPDLCRAAGIPIEASCPA
jgi:glycosyltransferase involved in cell wall biosynthesis